MNDLPANTNTSPTTPNPTPVTATDTSSSTSGSQATTQSPGAQTKVSNPTQPMSAGPSKELIGSIGVAYPEIVKPVEVGRDTELPKEVIRAGMKQTPSVIPVPPKLAQHGVKPAGNNVVLGSGASVTLPLTDTEIAQGLQRSITDSIRWLAEWCRRKLLQLRPQSVK